MFVCEMVVVGGRHLGREARRPAIPLLGRFEQVPRDYWESRSLMFVYRPPQI